MKLALNLFVFLFLSNVAWAQQDYYYYQGEKMALKISTTKILVKFGEEISFRSKMEAVSITSLVKPIYEDQVIRNNILILELAESTTKIQVRKIIAELNENLQIEYANPFFKYPGCFDMGLTNKFIVKLKGISYLEFEELIYSTNTNIVRADKYDKEIFIISTNKNSLGNSLELANNFFESGNFEFSEPSFLKEAQRNTNDQFYSQQWALENTGQSGGTVDADMDVNLAWTITTGRADIKVAVIDGGVELNHPDLVDNLLPGYDASGGGTNGGPLGGDPHGTATAGIIAAVGDNGIGVAGVAYSCKIIPVTLFLGTISLISDIEAADAINWAWDIGQADILSNSWSGIPPSSFIDNAISNAVTMGRDGLGSVVVFSVGNNGFITSNDRTVRFPASNSNVLAVGASTVNDVRANYSNFGSALDVVAPGDDIYTTDISGASGYTGTDYNSSFSGTSAACPNAAGVAALVLSVNPCLTQSEVRTVLEVSCDKVGATCFNIVSGHPNGTWDRHVGYGRINAYRAVQLALSQNLHSYLGGGTDLGASGNFKWEMFDNDCSNLSAAVYIVQRHEVRRSFNYGFTPNPVVYLSSNALSAANPNIGSFYGNVLSLTNTEVIVRAWVYEVISTISGAAVGWVPRPPGDVIFNINVLSGVTAYLALQNQTVTHTTTYSAFNIVAGYDVINNSPNGDYIVDVGADIVFHGGKSVWLEPGFKAVEGSTFRAFVDPFFTCTQYPNGKWDGTNSNYPSPIVYQTVLLDIDQYEDESIEIDGKKVNNYLNIYPNPISEQATIEYLIAESEDVTVVITNICGEELLSLQNKQKHKGGKYQITFNGSSLSDGIYLVTLESNGYKETKRFLKIK